MNKNSKEYKQGVEALENGEAFASCPYMFMSVQPCDQKTFEEKYRKKMTDWCAGYLSAKEAKKSS